MQTMLIILVKGNVMITLLFYPIIDNQCFTLNLKIFQFNCITNYLNQYCIILNEKDENARVF